MTLFDFTPLLDREASLRAEHEAARSALDDARKAYSYERGYRVPLRIEAIKAELGRC
jgi:hypothetical protein